jgi:hypothetical protein
LAFAAAITEGYREGFAKDREPVKDAGGAMAEVKFEYRAAYPPFKLPAVKEYVDLPEFANGCRLAVALATLEM